MDPPIWIRIHIKCHGSATLLACCRIKQLYIITQAIHAEAPEILVTGILAPDAKGGKIGEPTDFSFFISFPTRLALKAVFRIRDILGRIRIRGSIPMTNRSGSSSFLQ
jgi:hypothetical protein